MKNLKESLLDDEDVLMNNTNSEKIINFPKKEDYKIRDRWGDFTYYYFWSSPVIDNFIKKINPVAKYLVLSWCNIDVKNRSSKPRTVIYLDVSPTDDEKSRNIRCFCLLTSDKLDKKFGFDEEKRIDFMYNFLSKIKDDLNILYYIKDEADKNNQMLNLDKLKILKI